MQITRTTPDRLIIRQSLHICFTEVRTFMMPLNFYGEVLFAHALDRKEKAP